MAILTIPPSLNMPNGLHGKIMRKQEKAHCLCYPA